MIAAPVAISEFKPEAMDWKAEWRTAIRSSAELLELLGLQAHAGQLGVDHGPAFPLRVPRAFAQRMRFGDPSDPLLRQVLALRVEHDVVPGYRTDPVGDVPAQRSTGVLHKYQGRALLIVTGSCAVHCRYCFRRHYDYAEESVTPAHWDSAIRYLSSQDDIEEVLLSGGDPLSLDTPKLYALTQRLRELPRLRRLRIHTRLPIVLPSRVDTALVNWLKSLPWNVCIVLHSNHAQELDANVHTAVHAAMQRLRATGAMLLNQAVLLRGINDSVAAQSALSTELFAAGILPYYLHQLDPVAGAAHFAVPDREALDIIGALRGSLPGYLVPRLVREIPGQPNKTVLA